MFRKILAYILGHRTQLLSIASKVYRSLGADIFHVDDEKRRARIVMFVKMEIEEHYPQLEPYANIVIDYVVAEVRKALKRREGK